MVGSVQWVVGGECWVGGWWVGDGSYVGMGGVMVVHAGVHECVRRGVHNSWEVCVCVWGGVRCVRNKKNVCIKGGCGRQYAASLEVRHVHA
jgi:hypothetical protein